MTHSAYSTKRVTVYDETKGGVAGKAILYQDGYTSWCPDIVYDRDYRGINELSFGQALHALEAGKRIARSGWNGKDMWLAMSCGGSKSVKAENFWSPHNRAFALEQGGEATVLPSITMKTADGKILMGWLASQTDMFAKDWQIVGEV